MDVPAVLEALGVAELDEPVLLRLLLMAADQVTGEQTLVSSFVKRIAMPPAMVGPDVEVALELLGERRVFKPTRVVWDDTHRLCILEIVWVVADHTDLADELEPETSGSRLDAAPTRG
jgi:hypothetical protein